MRVKKDFKPMGLEEVYLTLVRDSDTGTPIRWKNHESIILVFSLALLERDDYYLSLRDQFGNMTGQSYSRDYITKHGLPDINFDPEILSKHPGMMAKYATNEVVFKEEIPMSYVTEVWVPSKSANVLYPIPINEHFLKTVENLLESRFLRVLKYVVRVIDKYPGHMYSDNMQMCSEKDIQASKVYKASFCKSNQSMRKNYLMQDDTPDTSKNSFYTHNWQVAVPLSTTKKIALNCGIDPKLVRRYNNQDILNKLIKKKEKEQLQFIIDNSSERNPRKIDKEFRERYLGKYKFEPPFVHQQLYPDKSDKEIDITNPFYELVNLIISFTEFELEYAIRNKEFTMTREDVTKHVDAFKKTYREIGSVQKLIITDILISYLKSSIKAKDGRMTDDVMYEIINDVSVLLEDATVVNKIMDKAEKEYKTSEDMVYTIGAIIVSEIKRIKDLRALDKNKNTV